jgi:hypothetical protein
MTLLFTLHSPLLTFLTMPNCKDGSSGLTTTYNVVGDQSTSDSVISNWWLAIFCRAFSVTLVNRYDLVRMYLSWRGFVMNSDYSLKILFFQHPYWTTDECNDSNLKQREQVIGILNAGQLPKLVSLHRHVSVMYTPLNVYRNVNTL